MSVTALRPSPRKPEVPELLSRARAITDMVRARVQGPRRTGASRRRHRAHAGSRVVPHSAPQAYGGFEYGFDVFVARGNRRMAEFATIQSRIAEATGCIDAARLMMFRDIAETYAAAERGEQIPLALNQLSGQGA
jgi:alkylation response protein AidB-like acyl-CoA dehydrogenase